MRTIYLSLRSSVRAAKERTCPPNEIARAGLLFWILFCACLVAVIDFERALASRPELGKATEGGPPPGGRLISACQVISRPGDYQLSKDVSSPGTCFGIQADNVTLHLNKHTVTYGTLPSPRPSFGVLGVACWDHDFGVGNPCGGSFNNLSVFDGTITQAAPAAAFSHGIRLGQGFGNGLKVDGVTFNLSADSSIPIYTTYVGTHSVITNNIINSTVTLIQNRHQMQGQAIKFADSSKVKGPATISGNRINGGAQGGIFSAVIGTRVFDNVVSQKGIYTNDFGIYAWADNGEVFHNVVNPISGRGIQIAGASSGERVYENKVVVVESAENREYGGCQAGGAYGIQFDDLPREAVAYQNNVTAKADRCAAQALRVTDSRAGAGNSSHDNTYIAQRVGRSTAVATGFGSGGATGFLSERDVFVGDTSAVGFDWDGGQNIVFRECRFVRGANPAAEFVTFSFRNGKDQKVSGIRFIDGLFESGANPFSTDMKPIGSNGDWPGSAEYFIDWTLTVRVRNSQEKPISGADVAVSDVSGHLVFQGATSQEGTVSIPLTERRVYNTATSVVRESRTPHRVEIRKKGCPSQTFSISANKKIFREILLDCGSG